MDSLKSLYRIGRGPSSSHTIGPEKICKIFMQRYPNVDRVVVELYGSLAMTGRGHNTDYVCKQTFLPIPCEVVFCKDMRDLKHPNTMRLIGYKNYAEAGNMTAYSIGGGEISVENCVADQNKHDVYSFSSFKDISEFCKNNNIRIHEYVEREEGIGIRDFMQTIWSQMKLTIKNGLEKSGYLPGALHVERKAKSLISSESEDESEQVKENRLVCAYAFASCEENACGETVVTAPTCGSCGILPAVMYYHQLKNNLDDSVIINALETAGLIGLLIKTNASISGAECGCQAEVGSACSMAAAALAELKSMSIDQIEYSAEIAMEHHLGLTCDPIYGLVQIPCIERNAVAAMRAINAVNLANFLVNSRKISFDLIVKTMYETGKDLLSNYRETSEGGMAKLYKNI